MAHVALSRRRTIGMALAAGITALEAYPESLNGSGPYGLTLLHHARQGGVAAASVVTYLQSLGGM